MRYNFVTDKRIETAFTDTLDSSPNDQSQNTINKHLQWMQAAGKLLFWMTFVIRHKENLISCSLVYFVCVRACVRLWGFNCTTRLLDQAFIRMDELSFLTQWYHLCWPSILADICQRRMRNACTKLQIFGGEETSVVITERDLYQIHSKRIARIRLRSD